MSCIHPLSIRLRANGGVPLVLATVALAIGVAPVRAETLADALASAYRYNPRLDAARASLRATDEEVARANAGYRPVIQGTADVGWQRTETDPASPTAGETHPKGYAVTASQPLFRGFRTLNTVREAEATVRAGRETLRIVEQSVLLDAVAAYADVVRDMAVVRVRESNVTVLSTELRSTREKIRVGEATVTDQAQAEARRALAVSQLDLARANLKISRAAFERHIGRPPQALSDPQPIERLLPKTLDEAIALSARETPTVIAALYREQSSRHTVDRIRGELLPSLQLDASYGRRFDPSTTIDRSETSAVTGRLTVPIYSSGEVEARVRQAKHTHVGRMQEIEQARGEAQAVVVQAWAQFVAAKAQLVSDRASVAALSRALAGIREEQRSGQRTILDVLNGEQELLNAQVNVAVTQRNITVFSYTLLSAVGRLNVASLGIVSEVYDPTVHYMEVRRKGWGTSITHADGRVETLK
jgi:outer membrane protein